MASLSRLLTAFVLASFAFSVPAVAGSSHDRTQFGHDVTVGADEEVSEVTCFGCNVRVRGNVAGDVTTFGGTILVEDGGQIAGDLTSFGGDVRLDSGSEVQSITVFGGKIRRDPRASVSGDVTTFAGGSALWLFLIFGFPFLLLGGIIWLIVWLVRRFSQPTVPVTARV
jgi:hypothetical protein